ncbi:hypothetical protein [Pseudoalteromonas luteoviolacea]|uniref:hypothetical protein n=1 Tax=Pseudoalteromonas luteoviolacea TaxID=43657 RepID=UPI001B3906EF|nr:hypothetical protein [Pseudoalteromonas luteoviolacea]MBQ4839799.1 hypothetical protein [Pseudoalteromonas luteoviolacea]
MTDYYNGAITALSYMAEQGAKKEDILSVAEIMDIDLSDLNKIDESDRERFQTAFAEL